MDAGYWLRNVAAARVTRRRLVGGAATIGLAAAGSAGCSRTGTDTAAKPAASAATTVDSTKGRPGGTLNALNATYPAALTLVAATGVNRVAGITHSKLLALQMGRAGIPGDNVSLEPELAQAMPEQPDQLTYVFKLKQANFQNGRPVNSEDVRYSYERFAFWEKSAYKVAWAFVDKVETPDARTVVLRTKGPYADTLLDSVGDGGQILAREFEEGPEAATKLMGSGAYVFVKQESPISMTFRKNTDYFDKPYPYFDQINLFSYTDDSKRIADFSSRALHTTWWVTEEPRDQIKRNRPDAKIWPYAGPAWAMHFRCDKPPFQDKRVRQALSMATDRKKIREATSKGEGEDDQVLSPTNGPQWGFRKPAELGAAAKYWKYDPAEAKKLLSAAGIDKPIEANWYFRNTVGQQVADTATLTVAQWRELGIANITPVSQISTQYQTTTGIGNYDGMGHDVGIQGWAIAQFTKNRFYAPPGGVKVPTLNIGHVEDPRLNAAFDKQQAQFNRQERLRTWHEIEDIFAEEQYRVAFSTYSETWFSDPSLRNIVMPVWGYALMPYYKYWWFES